MNAAAGVWAGDAPAVEYTALAKRYADTRPAGAGITVSPCG